MKFLLVLFILILSTLAHATHNRFWLGQKKQSISSYDFVDGLNQMFFQEAVKVGSGKGLDAYMPYVSQMKEGRPDEIALLIYETEEKYKTIRSTPEGKNYGELHWMYFEKGNSSKSTVSIPFNGNLSVGGAFELNPAAIDWQAQQIHFFIYQNSGADLTAFVQNFQSLKSDSTVYNSIILITEKLIYEYRAVTSSDKIQMMALNLPIVEYAKLQSSSAHEFRAVQPGQGINFQFE